MDLRIHFAPEGQRPGNKPAQGNALGSARRETPALKGRHTLLRPFRAGSVPTITQGVALGWLVCGPLAVARAGHTQSA